VSQETPQQPFTLEDAIAFAKKMRDKAEEAGQSNLVAKAIKQIRKLQGYYDD
jgi:hypothetical protein